MNRFDHVQLLTNSELESFTAVREGETKFGEQIIIGSEIKELNGIESPFVIFGIPEDIGIRANRGIPGAAETWTAFLKAFCNIQSNEFNASKPVVLGHIVTEDLMYQAAELDTNAPDYYVKLGTLVEILDQRVSETVAAIVDSGKVPIAIGGGHNNAYGMLKGTSMGKGQSVNALNFDAHTDYRRLEERHSGNGFSYARSHGYLSSYHVHGLQKNYTPAYIFEQFDEADDLSYSLIDENKLSDLGDESSQVAQKVRNWKGPFGVELDCDVIAHFSSSAISPSGYTLDDMRFLMSKVAELNPSYYHICEADSSKEATVGKALSYLVSDILRS